jgi:prolipoprotein diacylglyceryl transferase
MNPVALSVFGYEIRWYGIFIASAMVLGVFLAMKEAKRVGMDPDIITDIFLWIMPAAIIGARLYYVLFEWDYYRQHYSEILAIKNGGLAIHGGVIASLIVGYIFVKKRGINFWKTFQRNQLSGFPAKLPKKKERPKAPSFALKRWRSWHRSKLNCRLKSTKKK